MEKVALHKYLGLLMGVCLLACTPTSVPYTVLAHGTSAGRYAAVLTVEVMLEAPQFARIFQALHADQLLPPVPPAVDFNEACVVLVTLGERPTAGYGIEVVRVERQEDTVRIYVQLREPLPALRQAAVRTQPYVLVQIPWGHNIHRLEVHTTAGVVLAVRPMSR